MAIKEGAIASGAQDGNGKRDLNVISMLPNADCFREPPCGSSPPEQPESSSDDVGNNPHEPFVMEAARSRPRRRRPVLPASLGFGV